MISVVEVSQWKGRKICLFFGEKTQKGQQAVADPEGSPPPPPPPLCLDETEAQRAEKKFSQTGSPPPPLI